MSSKICTNCETLAAEGVLFCTKCGSSLVNSCHCGYHLFGFESVCPQCGIKTETSLARNINRNSEILPEEITESGSIQNRKNNILLPEFHTGDELLGQYRVIKKIGSSEKGVVYQVLHLALNEEMAIKAVGSFESVNELFNEYRDKYKAQVNIRHKNILHIEVPVKLAMNNVNYLILPMELAMESLADWMHRHPVDDKKRLEKGLKIFQQLCLGVEAIHEKGLVHLDLKPRNLLLTGDEENPVLKITDFGLSHSMSRQEKDGRAYVDGSELGVYMAPEQFKSAHWKEIGVPADIYALGMILYELLDGDLPYSGSSKQILEKKLDKSIVISSPQGPKPLGEVVMACLDREKSKRPSSVKELMELVDNSYRLTQEQYENRQKAQELLDRTLQELKKEGNLNQALEQLQQADELDPDNDAITGLLAEVQNQIILKLEGERIRRENDNHEKIKKSKEKLWYECNETLFESEKSEMTNRYPQFKIGKLDDNRLFWHGKIKSSVLEKEWYLQIVYENNFGDTNQKLNTNSIKVYSVEPDFDDLKNELGTIPYLSQDSNGYNYIDVFRNHSNKDKNLTVAAALYVRRAEKWINLFESWLEDQIETKDFLIGL